MVPSYLTCIECHAGQICAYYDAGGFASFDVPQAKSETEVLIAEMSAYASYRTVSGDGFREDCEECQAKQNIEQCILVCALAFTWVKYY